MFTHHISETILHLSLSLKDFEAAQAAEFKDYLGEVDMNGISSIEIDFSSVEFIDSSGVGALVSVQKKLNQSGGVKPVAILNAGPTVQSVLELLQLQNLFDIRTS